MKRLRSSATRPPGTMPATLSFAPIHSVVTPTPAPTKLGMTSTWMPLACAAPVKQARRKNLPTTTAAAAATAGAHPAAALIAAGAAAGLLRPLRAEVARLVLVVQRLHAFARLAGGTPLFRFLHVRPAAAFLVLLPVAALVAPIHVAVAAGVDVVVASAPGDSGVSYLGGLHVASARPADAGALAAPAVVAVVDVDVGMVVADVDATAAAIAARSMPAATHGETEEQADGEAGAVPVGVIGRRVIHRADIGRIVVAGAVYDHAVWAQHRAVVPRRVADEYRGRRAAVHAHIGHVMQGRACRDGVDDRGHGRGHDPGAGGPGAREPHAVLRHVVGLRIDADHRNAGVVGIGERRAVDRLPLRLAA